MEPWTPAQVTGLESKRHFVHGVHHPIWRVGHAENDKGERIVRPTQYPHARHVESMGPDGSTNLQRTMQYVKGSPKWHWDWHVDYGNFPWGRLPTATFLHCKRPCSEDLGLTFFADTTSAFERLPEEAQAELEGLDVLGSLLHDGVNLNRRRGRSNASVVDQNEAERANCRYRAQLVTTHPITGRKALSWHVFSTYATIPASTDVPFSAAEMDDFEIAGSEDRSAARLRDLFLNHATSPEFTLAHSWRKGDIVIFDNSRTMHSASYQDDGALREMWRMIVRPHCDLRNKVM